jgi:hypothetical protein
VFDRKDTFGEAFGGIVVIYVNGPLQNYWPVVELFVHKMYRAAGNLYAVLDRLLLNI